MKKRNELVGRFMLWANAIYKTKELLKIAQRASLGKDQDFQIKEQDAYNIKEQEFIKQHPAYQLTGNISISELQKFGEINPRQFPTMGECFHFYDSCIELAIIYFCQIFNSGYGEEGSASKNDKSFRDEHLTVIISRVFTTPDKLEKFNDLKEIIIKARDKMIGHADADAYKINHGNQILTMKGPKQIWRDIDLIFWQSFLEKMKIVTYEYSNEIKLQNYNA